MKVLFNLSTRMVTGLNRPALPFEFELEIKGTPILTKTVQEVRGQVQKVDKDGQLLYKDNVTEEGFDEVTNSQKVTKFEENEVTNEWIDEDGYTQSKTITKQVPVEFEDLEPVMVDNLVDVTFTFKDNPTAFHYDEVVKAPVELTALEALEHENHILKNQLSAQTSRSDFIEELIAELAMEMYS